MFAYRGSTALITGASSGIGAEFARELAARGANLILVARAQDVLEQLAADLQSKHNIQAHVLAVDLSREQAAQEVARMVAEKGLQVDLLVNNAGMMTHGPFEQIPPAQEHAEIMLNVTALVGLTHAFLPAMLARRSGAVIQVASVAGFQPIPYLATYAATKAFVISFSVALYEECRDRNVHILGLCPGTTSTELFIRGQAEAAALGGYRNVKQVVATALRGLDSRRSLIVDGLKNSLLTYGPRLIPRWFAARCAGNAIRPRMKKST